jgi:predicted metal-dependent hydrolase
MINGQTIIPEHEKTYRYVTGESHKYLGHYYTLSVHQTNDAPHVYLQGENLVMACNHPDDMENKEFLMDMWYREKARETFVPIVADAVVKASPYKLQLPHLRIYRMLNRWGSCSPKSKILIMNLELIKVPDFCIEYIALHEMIHFKYPSHNFAFSAAMGTLMPDWQARENFLNTWYPI